MIDIHLEEGFDDEMDTYYVNEPIFVRKHTIELAYCRAKLSISLGPIGIAHLPILFVDALLELHDGLSEEAAMQLYHMHYDEAK